MTKVVSAVGELGRVGALGVPQVVEGEAQLRSLASVNSATPSRVATKEGKFFSLRAQVPGRWGWMPGPETKESPNET